MTDHAFRKDSTLEMDTVHFFRNKLNLSVPLGNEQAAHFLDMLLTCEIPLILSIIDSSDHTIRLLTEEIPQFAEAPRVIDNAISTVCFCGKDYVGYEDLGYYLIRENRNTLAYRKYGENYGKGAVLLGLLCNRPGAFYASALSRIYLEHLSVEQRDYLKIKLLLRIPLIQELLWKAKESEYNGYDSMRMFSKSTMIRRGQCPRWMLPALYRLKDKELDRRVNNLYWKE